MTAPPLSFEHWTTGAAAAVLFVATAVFAVRRTPAVPRATLYLAGVGGLLSVLAAGGLAWMRPISRPLDVLVDLSPSTRGAAYRDRATLTRRVRELLGETPFTIRYFAAQVGDVDASATTLPDLPASQTKLPDSAAPAVVLFSDGRFVAPGAAPQVFCVVDPNLEDVNDAAVKSLDVRSDAVSLNVRSGGTAPRPLAVRGVVSEPTTIPVRPGSYTLSRKLEQKANVISASFGPGDAWPENDALRSVAPPPEIAERWWVGGSKAAGGWRSFTTNELPTDPMQYLAASVVVLDNVSAHSLDDARRVALEHYVRDLGGGLLILGGDRAFAAGGYPGTILDTISPLASTPPEPTTHWILLADASGSMNQEAGGGKTRWQYAAEAVMTAAKQLSPADLLSLGSFAADVRWWSRNRSVGETAFVALPPADARPGGPTNLGSALRQVATTDESELPTNLLVATDAQASIENAAALIESFKSRRVRVHVLVIGETTEAKGLAALKSIAAATGGTVRDEPLPDKWADGLRQLTRAAQGNQIERIEIRLDFRDPVASLGAISTSLWNRTWPRANATALAESTHGADRLTMAAQWNVGEGRVAAAAFSPTLDVVDALARVVERPPRDPRFKVTWNPGSTLRVSIDAVDQSKFLNGESFTLELRDSNARLSRRSIPQSGPGRYELSIDAPAGSALARVRHGEQTLDQIPLPARYPPEFDEIGNDRTALRELARRTGGAVIEPGVTRRLDIPWPRRATPLATFLGTAGAALVAAGLVRWRVGS